MRRWKPRPIVGEPGVTLVIASYLPGDERRQAALFCLLHSLRAQSYPRWKAVVVHDGPLPEEPAYAALRQQIAQLDQRITFVETAKREGSYGHPHRQPYASRVETEFVGFSNDDNYYCPVYFEAMLSELTQRRADFAFCDMVHSHRNWQPMTTAARSHHLDVGAFIVRTELVRATPWVDMNFAGDGTYIEALAVKAKLCVKVPACFFVHN